MLLCDACFYTDEKHNDFFGWVGQPLYRGTFDVVISCLLIIITCTWSVLHLNLPAPDESSTTTWLRKGRWAIFAIFAPEVVTLFAACQWSSARSSIQPMHALGVTNWTSVHGFYADGGGFILCSPDMPPFPVNSRAIHYLIERHYLDAPAIRREDIVDRSKSDIFVRGVAIIQTSWMIIQCLARLEQSLEIPPLEIITVAFAICTIASYFFWIEKPLDIESHSHLTTTTHISRILRDAGDAAKEQYDYTPMDFVGGCGPELGLGTWGRRDYFKTFGSLTQRPIQRIADDFTPPPSNIRLAFSQWFISMVHCGIHVAGWNFPFPAVVEQYLWRIASTTMFGILTIWGLVAVLSVRPGLDFTISLMGVWERTTTSESKFRRWALDLPADMCAILYVIARTVLLVQAVITMRWMPSSVFRTVQWTNYIPHV